MKEVSTSLQSHRQAAMGWARDTLGVEWLGVTIGCHSDHLEMSGPHVPRGGTQTAHAHVGTGATLLCVCVGGKGPGATSQQYGVPEESLPCVLPFALHFLS